MTLPGLLLGLILALLYGAGYHFLRGGSLRRLFLFLLLSTLGFLAGQMAGAALNLTFFKIGTLLVGTATVGSLIFLVIGDWLWKRN